MNIGSICRRDLVVVDSEATPVDAARLMREHHVGTVIVAGHTPQGAVLSGIVTDRDLVMDVLATGVPPESVRMKSLARAQVVSVKESDDLMAAIDVMQTAGVRRLLVVNERQDVVGIVSLDELMGACAHEVNGLARALQAGLAREAAQVRAPKPAAPQLRFPAMGTTDWTQ